MDYESGIFQKLYETPLGRELWEYLVEDQCITKMEAASALGKPAVEPISNDLLMRFKDKIRENRVKQMIGHMVRQIMFSRGYIIHTQNSSVSNSVLFKKATTYIQLDKISDNKYRQGYVHGANELYRYIKDKSDKLDINTISDWIEQLVHWQTEGLIHRSRDFRLPPKLI